jgi:hypothetical protein
MSKNDLTVIIDKLRAAGLIEDHDKGMSGVFSIRDHGHLLDPEELSVWLYALHNGSKHDDRKCSDLHSWNVNFSPHAES